MTSDAASIISYENGSLADDKIIDLFAHLVRTAAAWSMQGSYGRQAARLIEHGYITADGEVLRYPMDDEEED